jgi:PEGA domain
VRGRGALGLAVVAGALAWLCTSARASDDDRRLYGVVDLSDPPAAPAVRQRVERAALARGLTPVADPAIQKALLPQVSPGTAVRRLVLEARRLRERGDCAAGLPRAREGETAALEALSLDDARALCRVALAVVLACADSLGHADEARAAAARLRHLGALPPDGVSQELWDRYPAAAASPGGKRIELGVDSDPPNARVAIDFHRAGVTPLTIALPPGPVTIEIEKDGYKKAVRQVVVGAGAAPVRVSVTLGERRLDRPAEIVRRLAVLRGTDPAGTQSVLGQIAQLGRVDVLVAFVARGAAVTVWWFDADRGDFEGEPKQLK